MLTACFADSKNYQPFQPPEDAATARKEGYGGDAFYVSRDGHFVGDDGFIVPMDFGEFLGRFPDYARNWVRKRLHGKASKEDIEDWSQDLLVHLSALPAVSKHRGVGKKDVVQTFNPFRQYGASERRFKSYIDFCLTNRFNTLYRKRSLNPLASPANVSLSWGDGEEKLQPKATDEYLYSHSAVVRRQTERGFRSQEERLRTDEFTRFVLAEEPDAALVLCALGQAGNFADARRNWCADCGRVPTTVEIQDGVHQAHDVGIGQKRFDRARVKLGELAKKFKQCRSRRGACGPEGGASKVGAKPSSARRVTL